MDNFLLLTMLKTDLGFLSTAYDERLTQYIESAKIAIERLGITLGDATDDSELIVMYASWKWRNRQTGAEMPRMLRLALNDRLFSEKASVADA